VAQVPTVICPLDLQQAMNFAETIGYPLVLKRTHGAQGRWVRRAWDLDSMAAALREFEVEGPSALIMQPEIVESRGRAVRAVITGGQLLAATERIAGIDEWRSNIAGGASQSPTELTDAELGLVKSAASVMHINHAGIDVLRTAQGPRILEVNGCPDFTSMEPYFDSDLAETVLLASM
jgi:ribosomal protein S6--L-glutamate ligase